MSPAAARLRPEGELSASTRAARGDRGRLLVVAAGEDRDAGDELRAVADLTDQAAAQGFRVEWIDAAASPCGLDARRAVHREDAQALVAEAAARVAADRERERRAQLPEPYFVRLERKVITAKHANVEDRSVGARASRFAARLALRIVRPLRKLQQRWLQREPQARATPERPSVEHDPAPNRDGAAQDLARVLARLTADDVVLLTGADFRHLEWLLRLTPAIGRDRPLDATLLVHLRSTAGSIGYGRGEVDRTTLARRWRLGAPFRKLWLVTDDERAADECTRELGLPVGAGLPRLEHVRRVDGDAPAVVQVREFAPVVLQVSAMWGRTGSTSIFDSQTRYLLDRGFYVLRIFLDHWPHHGRRRVERIEDAISENFEYVRPCSWAIAERDTCESRVAQRTSSDEFRVAGTAKRMMMLLAQPVLDDPATVAWGARAARAALVNHLPHIGFVEQLTRTPILFETHDIYTQLLDSHGVPDFVEASERPADEQLADEQQVFARAAACVNLSDDDDRAVAPHARISAIIRPYSRSREVQRRSWPDFVRSNGLGPEFLREGHFDLMLWGDWHGGNVRGVRWFVEEVLPRSQALRACRIVLAGRVSRGLPEGLAEGAGLLVAGFVDNLDDLIARTTVMLIPDKAGTGISIKAMDVFAMARPFVSTSPGVRCIDRGETGYEPTDDPDAFARDVERLLTSRSERARRQEVARRLYDLNFSQAAYSRAWDEVLERAVPDVLASAHPRSDQADSRPEAEPRPTTMPDARPEHPRISICICTYDRYDVLPDAIESALSQDLPDGAFELLVIDNSPDQQGAAKWRDRYRDDPRIVYHLEPTPGLSNARNVGTDIARAPVIAFMDDDAIASKHWAREVLAAFDAFPNAGIVGGRVYPKWIGDEGASWLHEDNIGYLSIVDWGEERRELTDKEWAAGCNISFRRDILRQVDGFSRSLGRIGSGASLLSNEETAVAQKVHALGMISVYAPAATVEHVIDPQRLSREWFRKRSAWQAVSDYLKNPEQTLEYSKRARQHLRQILKSGDRAVPLGAFHETDDKHVFKGDMGVIYDLIVTCLAGGFEMPPGEARPPRDEPGDARRHR